MRLLAIGDIHGCYRSLRTLEKHVAFREDDRIITLGDYVNRGPNSYAVIDWLISHTQTGQVIPLRGNHEAMMLEARNSDSALKEWIRCGGDATLASYSPLDDAGMLDDVPEQHWQFLEEQTLLYYETATHFFVHANAYPDCPLDEQPEYMLLWEPFGQPSPHQSDKIMICGHTSQKSGRPLSAGHAICIDTWACGKGWLTCLDVQSGQYWLANEQGETRTDWLA